MKILQLLTLFVLIAACQSQDGSKPPSVVRGKIVQKEALYFGYDNQDTFLQTLASLDDDPKRQDLVYEARKMVEEGYRYKMGGNGDNGSFDCSHFIHELFNRTGLYYPYTTTKGMTSSSEKLKEYFNVLTERVNVGNSKGFRPKAGDILVMRGKNSGHAVVVIDPIKCIAVNSSSFAWDLDKQRGYYSFRSGTENRENTGVKFHVIYREKRCKKGVWISWDKSHPDYKFTTLLRHKDFT